MNVKKMRLIVIQWVSVSSAEEGFAKNTTSGKKHLCGKANTASN